VNHVATNWVFYWFTIFYHPTILLLDIHNIPHPPHPTAEVIVEALPNVEGNLLGVVLFRPTDERIEGLKSGDHCGWGRGFGFWG